MIRLAAFPLGRVFRVGNGAGYPLKLQSGAFHVVWTAYYARRGVRC